ncbi:hypothetical protein [Lonepinella sp. BR2271]|uniref:hypothetical protein n=1 Tax=Lonepinella sp. BR2271 TaxID=3434550 RepID=UPI003F6DB69A
MEKFKKFIEAFMQSDTFKKLLEKIKGIFSPFVQKIQQSEKTNHLLSKMLSWVSQHKLVSTVVACVVVAPTFIGGTVDMPKECKGIKMIYDSVESTPIRAITHQVYMFPGLWKLVDEEDPIYALANRISAYKRHYDYDILNKLFQSKYAKLAKVSQESADNFVESIKKDCERDLSRR